MIVIVLQKEHRGRATKRSVERAYLFAGRAEQCELVVAAQNRSIAIEASVFLSGFGGSKLGRGAGCEQIPVDVVAVGDNRVRCIGQSALQQLSPDGDRQEFEAGMGRPENVMSSGT